MITKLSQYRQRGYQSVDGQNVTIVYGNDPAPEGLTLLWDNMVTSTETTTPYEKPTDATQPPPSTPPVTPEVPGTT